MGHFQIYTKIGAIYLSIVSHHIPNTPNINNYNLMAHFVFSFNKLLLNSKNISGQTWCMEVTGDLQNK